MDQNSVLISVSIIERELASIRVQMDKLKDIFSDIKDIQNTYTELFRKIDENNQKIFHLDQSKD